MNKDQVNGKLKDIGGQIQEKAAEIVGNESQQLKGLKNQVEGKTQEKLGDLKEAVKDATN
ncbi:MAG: CsbD family protein [Pseudomonadota bacterium]